MSTATFKHVPVWEGGNGNISLRTVARDEAEAINNFIEKEPILEAIGCYATKMQDVDGCEIVALVPTKFEFGDDRRTKADKARRKADADAEKKRLAELEAQHQAEIEAQEKAVEEARLKAEEEAKKLEEMKAPTEEAPAAETPAEETPSVLD